MDEDGIVPLRLLGLIMAVLLVEPAYASIVESFEGLSPGPNISMLPGLGILKPGINGPFTFPSGVTLTSPVPNPSRPASGVQVDDWSIGPASFGVGEQGSIDSAGDVPNGTAFLALDAIPGPIELTFPADVLSVGALVTGSAGNSPGSIVLTAFGDSNNILSTVRVPAVPVSAWPTNFIGVQSTSAIHKVWFQNSDTSAGFNVFVLDDLVFQPVPEPNYPPLVLVLISLGVGFRHLRRRWGSAKSTTVVI